jgi:hypothetical protein
MQPVKHAPAVPAPIQKRLAAATNGKNHAANGHDEFFKNS